MTSWANADVLIQLLERRRDQVLQFEDEARIFALSRWVQFLTGDAQLAALALEIMDDFKRELNDLTDADGRIRDYMEAFWQKDGPSLIELYKSRSWDNSETLPVYGSLLNLEQALKRRPRYTAETPPVFDDESDSHGTKRLANVLDNGAAVALQRIGMNGEAVPNCVYKVQEVAQIALLNARHVWRRHRATVLSSPGAALARVVFHIESVNPLPPQPDESNEDENKESLRLNLALFDRLNLFAKKAHELKSRKLRTLESDEVTSAVAIVAQDVVTVTNELIAKLLAGRSQLALIKRYAAQCEAFGADELRSLADNSKGTVEQQLTLRFAKYLFDQGLNPILNPTIGGLRPDVVAALPGAMLYVEAKQYSEKSPQSVVRNAYKQVWGTWATLTQHYSIPEAFLLVFRVAGPRVELREVLTHEGRRLYSVLVDISGERGSREKKQPITFDDSELLPRSGESEGE